MTYRWWKDKRALAEDRAKMKHNDERQIRARLAQAKDQIEAQQMVIVLCEEELRSRGMEP